MTLIWFLNFIAALFITAKTGMFEGRTYAMFFAGLTVASQLVDGLWSYLKEKREALKIENEIKKIELVKKERDIE